uniref:3-methylmercaptopropionyl-CoA ligase n=1 Tax=Sphingomonas sp. JE1 TaxID=1628059 RepID=A0A0D5A0A0_9SPHN|nr:MULTISPECIES: AMP-binding protein [unclassified Sphingomonas]AJW29586.1 Long-chain-fatty-acid--CoA ligase [Sphingomonas sp. JE1]
MSFYDEMKIDRANHSPLSPIRFLARAAHYFGDRISLIHGDLRWTWKETDTRCRRLASALTRLGIGPGDTVSVMAPNCPAIFEAQFGVPMMGAVINNLNVRIEPHTLAYILNHNQAKVLFVDSEISSTVTDALNAMERPPIIIDIVDPLSPGGDRIGDLTFEDLIDSGDPDYISHQPADELQPLSLNYTSGTTGDPKGVVYDHRNAYIESLGNLVSWGVSGHPHVLWAVPIFHANGWCYLWAMAGLGATNVMVRKPSGPLMLDLIDRHHVTHICGAPIIAQMMAHAPGASERRYDRPIRMLTAGAPPTSVEFIALEDMGIQLDQGYGLTEVWGPAILREPQAEWSELEPEQRARLKMRQGIPNLVLDKMIVAVPGTCDPVPRDGETLGEVLFSGNIVMRGYLRDPIATVKAFEGGYFHSGDLAVWHPDGSIELKDRAKDIIISGGENISSVELENAIAEIPDVLGVAVIGVQDNRWGERPWAFVEIAEGSAHDEKSILEQCRSRLVSFKLPKGVTFGPIPRTPTGKVQKFVLRESLGKQ